MKQDYRRVVKPILCQLIRDARIRAHRTQAEMAEALSMDTRSYVEIEHGNNLCSTVTFLLFLQRCCPDPAAVLDLLNETIKGADDEQPARRSEHSA